MTSSMVGLRRSSKALPKVKLPPKIGHGHWWSAACLIHYSFLNPSKIITCEKDMFSLSMRCTKNYNTCSWHWLTARAQFFSMTTPDCMVTQPTLQKLNELGYKVLPHLPYSLDLYPTDYHFFKHLDNFLQGKSFHNQQEAENAFQEFVKS